MAGGCSRDLGLGLVDAGRVADAARRRLDLLLELGDDLRERSQRLHDLRPVLHLHHHLLLVQLGDQQLWQGSVRVLHTLVSSVILSDSLQMLFYTYTIYSYSTHSISITKYEESLALITREYQVCHGLCQSLCIEKQ